MELSPEIKQALERLQAGITDTADLETLRRAFQAGQIVLATGERAVAIGGSVEDTVIVTGDNNIVSVFKSATAESVREALQKVLERIASDRYAASLQEYFRALRRYCAELPYLTLTDIRPPKNLDEVYVPLRARQRESEPLPRGPAAQEESLTVEQVLRQAQTSHLLILGQPGAGKSTLLRQLAERAYDDPHAIGLDRPHLPLLLPLRALAHAEGALEERLNQALQNELRLTRPLPAGFLDAWPQQLDTPWLFLLDGLDEVPADRYLSLKQWIGDLLAHPNIARVILTSRPSAYTEKEWESSRLSVYEIQPFTRDQTAELARRWFGEDASAFLQALETVRSSVLTETPLLITIAAKVYLERKSLPERRSQLYQEFVDIWLDEARERGLCDELDAALLDLAQPALAHLALAMTDHPDWTDEKSLIPVVAEYLDEQLNLKARAPAVAERFLRVMARRSGIFLHTEVRPIFISQHGDITGAGAAHLENLLRNQKIYTWLHPTFREYLAAWQLNSQVKERKGDFATVLESKIYYPWWHRVIVELAMITDYPGELINFLSNALSECKSDGGIDYDSGWEHLQQIASLLKEIAEHGLGYLMVKPLSAILSGPNEFVHSTVVELLGYTRSNQALPPLVNALEHSDPYIRERAVYALGMIGTLQAISPIIVALDNKEQDSVIEAAIAVYDLALTQIDDEHFINAIRQALTTLLDHPNPDIRYDCAELLGKIGDAQTVSVLEKLLDDDEILNRSTCVRDAAREAIARIRARMAQTDQQGDER
jgi:HEAT repeat protein